MTEQKDDSLVVKRVYRTPTQVTKHEQLVPGMCYRLHLIRGIALFTFLELNKTGAKVQVHSVKGDANLSPSTNQLELKVLGLEPAAEIGGKSYWYPHRVETAIDAYTAPNYSSFFSTYTEGVLEILGDSYLQADIKLIGHQNRQITCSNGRMWSPELGGKWFDAPIPDMTYSDMLLYADSRLALKVDNFWVVAHPKRT
jgi:hypothetical protein